jgi:hypothetical protein
LTKGARVPRSRLVLERDDVAPRGVFVTLSFATSAQSDAPS